VTSLAAAATQWYAANARDLPWRRTRDPWAVLVSEVMLQQTPVSRVLPVYEAWLARWPTPRALAAEPSGEAVRAWGRLGYPRRALRLHAAATAIAERGAFPDDVDDLLALPGVGAYTARAVAVFAFGQRHAVVDTNVRRVVARACLGVEDTPPSSKDHARVDALAPDASLALMELGALVCTKRAPRCDACPLACAWRANGRPAGAPRKAQPWHGTDRQARGALMAVLRASHGPADLTDAWPDATQRARALRGLVEDGLAVERDGGFVLPG
jgi:A/G-specific adenine glycosylase